MRVLDPVADLAHRFRRPLSALTLLATVVVPLPSMMRFDGKAMEEGLLLVGGELLLDGRVPHGDFESLYGPADIWAVGALFAVFGVSITVERFLGLAYRLLLLWAVHRITRRWGWGVATGATALAWGIIAPFGLMAYSWIGAVAFGTASLAVALDAEERPRRWTAAGALAGAALLFRADLVLALALGLVPRLRAAGRAPTRRFLYGLSAGVVGYLAHFATASPSAVFLGMFVDPVIRMRPGRRLPVPPSWSDSAEHFTRLDQTLRGGPVPSLDRPAQLAALFWIVLLAAAVTVWLARRSRNSRLLAFALFAAGTLPQLLQRPSHNHIRFVAVLVLPALVAAVACRIRWRAVSGLAAVLVLVALIAVAPHHIGRAGYRTFLERPEDVVVSHGGREIPVGDRREAADIEAVLAALDAAASPGDRVFVGPERLARTNYSETFLYHLMPDYPPGSYHLQMNPGLANRQGGRLADDVAASDWLILTDKFDDWSEPNSSVEDGDPRADAVVESSFCALETIGGRTLYGRC